eukprot:6627930-Prymnesium_polylepis.2
MFDRGSRCERLLDARRHAARRCHATRRRPRLAQDLPVDGRAVLRECARHAHTARGEDVVPMASNQEPHEERQRGAGRQVGREGGQAG